MRSQGRARPPVAAAELLERLTVAGHDGDVGPGLGQPDGETAADDAGGAGEEDVCSGDSHPASVHDGRPATRHPPVVPAAAVVEPSRPTRPRGIRHIPRSALRKRCRGLETTGHHLVR